MNLYYIWSGRSGSNRRRPAWEADILPLNYARSIFMIFNRPVIVNHHLHCRGRERAKGIGNGCEGRRKAMKYKQRKKMLDEIIRIKR